jgi:diguanylate cyclase (GGDEF)-like protein
MNRNPNIKKSRSLHLIVLIAVCPFVVLCQTATSISAVHRMAPEMAAKALPVVAAATVTGVGGWPYGINLQDGEDGIYSSLPPNPPPLAVGQRVVVRGKTDAGRFAPIILASAIEVTGWSGMPKPYPADARELASGDLDNRFVEVRGVVRATTPGALGDGAGVFMVIDMNPGTVHVAVARGISLDAAGFVDATVRVAGIVGVEYNKRRQALGANVIVNRPEDIVIMRQPSANPASGPTTPIGDIFRWGLHQDWSHRIKVSGILTVQRPGEFLILQDGDQAIKVEARDKEKMPLGTRLDVSGFAVPAEFGPILRDSVILRRGAHEPVEPLTRKASQLTYGDDNWLLIRLRARLIEAHESENGVALSLEDGGIRFTAAAPGNARKLLGISQGSLLELTGIYEVEVDTLRAPVGFRILIRTPEDVAVLNAGPWLNGARFLWSALILGVTAAVCALWALTLRRRVRHQTALLSRTAALQADRSQVLELIGRNAPLSDIGKALVQLIERPFPAAGAAVGICCRGEWTRIGPEPDSSRESIVNVTTGSAEVHAEVFTGKVLSGAGDVIQTCRECLALALEHHDLHDQLLAHSLLDPLTRLSNRRSLDLHLERVLSAARRNQALCAILVIDLDRFKPINDTLGHAAGDLVLEELARRFRSLVREHEMVARVGGDEFVVVLEDIRDFEYAHVIASRLAARAALPMEVDGVEIRPFVSIGVALYPVDGESAQCLRNTADARMYEMKMARENRPVFDPSLMNQLAERT